MTRDRIKDASHFQDFISRQVARIEKFNSKIELEEVKADRIPAVKRQIFTIELHKLISMYSNGTAINEIATEYKKVVDAFEQSWQTSDFDGYYSFDQYYKVITVLSMGVLLDAEDSLFHKAVAQRDIVPDSDKLLDYLISAKTSREGTNNLVKGNPYAKLAAIIDETDKTTATNMLSDYLKGWYPLNGKLYWYENHKSKHDTYFGYWSFEAAAIVKIMGLDDSIFKDNQYYPYDLVHWQETIA